MGSHIANSPWGLGAIYDRVVGYANSGNYAAQSNQAFGKAARSLKALGRGYVPTGKQRFIARRSAPVMPASMRGYFRKSGYFGRYNRRTKYPSPAEMKFFDTAMTFNFDNTPEVPATGQLLLVRQGTGPSQRIGRKIVLKSIEIKGSIGSGSGNKASVDIVHLYVILDRQCNGAAAAYGDVFDNSVSASAPGAHMRNMANVSRFKILKHVVCKVQPVTGGATPETAEGGDFHWVQYFAKLNLPIEYAGTAAPDPEVITNIRSNNIFVLAMSAALNTGDDDNSAFLGTCRVRFIDS